MSAPGLLPLPLVDACELPGEVRDVLRPGGVMAERDGTPHALPRWFYEVDSWKTACDTRLAEHFTLHELLELDVREAPPLRRFPRYVPLAVTALAAHLELLRQAVGTVVRIAANGGYRSPSHRLSDHASTHCWGTAANIYKIGDEYLDTQEKIEKYAEVARRVAPALWIRPYGQEKDFADDHLHVDIGYVRVTPRGHAEHAAVSDSAKEHEEGE